MVQVLKNKIANMTIIHIVQMRSHIFDVSSFVITAISNNYMHRFNMAVC